MTGVGMNGSNNRTLSRPMSPTQPLTQMRREKAAFNREMVVKRLNEIRE